MSLEELVVGTGFLVVFGAQPHVIGNSYRVRDIGDGMQGASFVAPRDLALSRLGHSSLPSHLFAGTSVIGAARGAGFVGSEPTGVAGFEPATYGFGDRRSTN
jgi:hypothetical protein